jgi:hypothetical protein
MLAIVLLALVSVAILTISFTTPFLTGSGVYSAKDHVVYTTVTTIIATMITMFGIAQLRYLLLSITDNRLQKFVDSLEPNASGIEKLNGRWRTILGIGHLSEQLQNWSITILYLLASLNTAAIVASVTPGTSLRTIPYTPNISIGPSRCSKAVDLNTSFGDYTWSLGNGSKFIILVAADGCPTRQALTLAPNINIINPEAFAYVDNGVAVHTSALGTPISVYSSQKNLAPELNTLIGDQGGNVVSTTQCVPVMIQNPISCRPGGTMMLTGNYQATLFSSDGKCNNTANFMTNTLQDSVMLSRICPHDELGQGTIILGASWIYAHDLALSVGDIANAPHPVNGSTYAVTCTVDARHVFESRTVTLNLQAMNISESDYTRALVSEGGCDMSFTPDVDDVLMGIAAAAPWQLLNQDVGTDGWFDLISQLTLADTTGRQPPWAFQSSQNALEDVLGLTAALVVSRINSSTVTPINASAQVTAMRLGSGNPISAIFSIPPIITTFFLVLLIFRTRISESPCTSDLSGILELGKRLKTKERETILCKMN